MKQLVEYTLYRFVRDDKMLAIEVIKLILPHPAAFKPMKTKIQSIITEFIPEITF